MIKDEGNRMRAEAETNLKDMETKLKSTLSAKNTSGTATGHIISSSGGA